MSAILYLGPPYALDTARDVLEPRWPVIGPEPTPERVNMALPTAIGVLDASMRVRFDRATLEKAPALRVIATATTGADHIDTQALADRGVPLFTLAGERKLLYGLTAAAEHSWLLLMACARGLRAAVRHVVEGNWKREEFPGIMLKGKTLGLIGCGRIGSWMGRYGRAFGMEVFGYDPFIDLWPEQIEKRNLGDLLRTVDFVSVHVPLNDHTRGMIGEHEFALMKSGIVFVNTSRGKVTDEQALLRALCAGRVGAAGLDVLDGEPATDRHPLVEYARTHENLIITPHIGGFCPEAVKLVVAHAARRIARILSGDQHHVDD
jgi:phosphoglycerate dehydrogenase-like enzyme